MDSVFPSKQDVDVTEATEAGNGMIDWKRILSRSKQAHIKHFYVEQDKPADPLKSVAVSYGYLRQLRF